MTKLRATNWLINELNLTELTQNSLMKYGDQVITGKHVFVRPIHIGHLHLHDEVRISDRKFTEFAQQRETDIL